MTIRILLCGAGVLLAAPTADRLAIRWFGEEQSFERRLRLEGTMAPELTLKGIDGGTFKLSAQRGKVVVVEVWRAYFRLTLVVALGVYAFAFWLYYRMQKPAYRSV